MPVAHPLSSFQPLPSFQPVATVDDPESRVRTVAEADLPCSVAQVYVRRVYSIDDRETGGAFEFHGASGAARIKYIAWPIKELWRRKV